MYPASGGFTRWTPPSAEPTASPLRASCLVAAYRIQRGPVPVPGKGAAALLLVRWQRHAGDRVLERGPRRRLSDPGHLPFGVPDGIRSVSFLEYRTREMADHLRRLDEPIRLYFDKDGRPIGMLTAAKLREKGLMHDCPDCQDGMARTMAKMASKPGIEMLVGQLFWAG